jgi:hypothetical protein
MRRALWSVPVAVVVWYVLGFGPWFLGSQRGAVDTGARELLPVAPSAVDVVAIGGLVGGIAAGMVVRRLQIAVPVMLLVAGGAWSLARRAAELADAAPLPQHLRGMFISLLVATGLGTIAGAVGSYRSVLAAIGLALPVASYVRLPGPEWAGELTGEFDGLLLATGFAMLLYVACWHNGWRALTWWPVVTGAYLASFALMSALARVATMFGPGAKPDPDAVAETALDGFVQSFRPFLETYWPWLAVAVFLAVMIVALKIRVLPPATPVPRPVPVDDRGNDAYLPDDLGWFDHEEEPLRLIDRLPRRREPVG